MERMRMEERIQKLLTGGVKTRGLGDVSPPTLFGAEPGRGLKGVKR